METEIIKGYHKNGKLRFEHTFVNRIQHGVQKSWYDNGNLCIQYFMSNGVNHGLYQDYTSETNGKLYLVLQQNNNLQHGPKIKF